MFKKIKRLINYQLRTIKKCLNQPVLLNLYRMDPSNVGDLYSTPLKYYKFSISTEENNIASNEWDVVSLGYFKAIILGGGGMFHFQNKIQNIIQEYPGGLIGCGRINLGIIK